MSSDRGISFYIKNYIISFFRILSQIYTNNNALANNEKNNSQNEETISENSTQTNSVDVNDYYAEEDLTVVQTGEERNINLWHEGNIPTTTNYTRNNGNYFDDPDFMPYMTEYPVLDGTEVKGAVLINPGGAFQFRAERPEGSINFDGLTNGTELDE